MKTSKHNHFTRLDDEYYILCNLLQNSNDLIDHRLYEALRNPKNLDDPEWTACLLQKGYLVEDTEDEEGRMREKIAREYHRVMDLPGIHTIIVSHQCNFACTYCFERYRADGTSSEWDDAKLEQVFSVIEQSDRGKKGRNPIGIFGGEPLLPGHRQVLHEILERGSRLGYSFFLPTNGYYLAEFAELISRYPLYQLQITLDGPEPVHDRRRVTRDGAGTFAKIVQGIDRALERKLPVYIRCNIEDATLRDLSGLLAFIRGKRWFEQDHFHLYLSPCRREPGRCFQDFTFAQRKQISRILADAGAVPFVTLSNEAGRRVFNPDRSVRLAVFNCDACYRQYFYDPAGMIYPCSESIGHPATVIGTHWPTWELNENHDRLISRNLYESRICAACPNRNICSGGCPYRALLDHGSLTARDCGSFLEVEKHRINAAKMVLCKEE